MLPTARPVPFVVSLGSVVPAKSTPLDAEVRIPEVERKRTIDNEPEEPRDPGFYSIDPRGEIPEEHFEGDEEAVTDWDGASVDFDIGEDE